MDKLRNYAAPELRVTFFDIKDEVTGDLQLNDYTGSGGIELPEDEF